ncbi:MAG TPA: hypothetical protein VHB97_14840, partial [Polyangia bacterium]|nr:hypothetical protein [Polyangia bacterium]
MESESVAAKRRVLVDALMMCLSRSKVVQVVDAKTVRGVLDTASKEMWREGEFRLDPIWKILIAQPGLSAEEVAPPLLVFKAYEKELGVAVRVPQALSAIPRGEQVRLRDALGIQRADFAQAIDEMKALAGAQASAANQQDILRDAAATVGEGERRKPSTAANKKVAAPAGPQAKLLAAGLALGGIAALAFGVWFALRDTSATYDLSDVAGMLQLTGGRAAGPTLMAQIADPKWDAMSTDERKKAASAVMDVEAGKGIKSLILLDKAGAER